MPAKKKSEVPVDADKKPAVIEEKKVKENESQTDSHGWLMNAECDKCGRIYCDHESKY